MNLRSMGSKLTYANVASSIALFAALGGTSYALTLPRNSIGARELRTGAITSSELRRGSVRSTDIRNRTVALKDLSAGTRSALRGSPGPPGPAGAPGISYFVESDSGGGERGNGGVTHRGGNEYSVVFPRSVAGCALVAGLADVKGGVTDATPDSTVIAAHDGDNAIIRTYKAGTAQPLPFALIAAC